MEQQLVLSSFNKSIDLNMRGPAAKVQIISLLYKNKTYALDDKNRKSEVTPYDVAWIRIFDEEGIAYDIVAQKVIVIVNDHGILIQVNAKYNVVSVFSLIDEIKNLFYTENSPLQDTNEKDIFETYMNELIKEANEHRKRRDLFIKNSSSNLDIVTLNKWVNARDELAMRFTKVEIMKTLLKENKKEIIEVIREKRIEFV